MAQIFVFLGSCHISFIDKLTANQLRMNTLHFIKLFKNDETWSLWEKSGIISRMGDQPLRDEAMNTNIISFLAP